MKGGTRKTRKRQPKKSSVKKGITSTNESSPSAEKSNGVSSSAFSTVSQSTACLLPTTPKRGRRPKVYPTSTPIHSPADGLSKISAHSGRKQAELQCTEVLAQLPTSQKELPCCNSKLPSKRKRNHPSEPRQLRKRVRKEQTETCSETKGPPVKPRRGRPPKIVKSNLQTEDGNQTSARPRAKFELAEQDDSLLSSDLSIELSHYEEPLPVLTFEDDPKSEDEEDELPSFSVQMDKKPPSIREGVFVWCKLRSYPFWPALVKKVNHKQKKASIIFIDDLMINKKGFTVALKTMKPFDCEDAEQLICKAKEEYDAAIKWSLELITDYTIRIACGSFSGSFVEYFAHDMSYPVRRKYPQAASERLTIASDSMMEDLCDDHKEDSFSEQQGEVSKVSKRLLPDRTHAAHNRANEKLVHFIVKQRMVDQRLLAVIRGQQQSRWLRTYQSANRKRVVNIYLEDDQQLDQVYCYLSELYSTAASTAPCLVQVKPMERVPFVLDVLLPEAIIHAIAGVDNVSVKKAEEKYLKGRRLSNRERQEFDLIIERQMRKKTLQTNTESALFPESVTDL